MPSVPLPDFIESTTVFKFSVRDDRLLYNSSSWANLPIVLSSLFILCVNDSRFLKIEVSFFVASEPNINFPTLPFPFLIVSVIVLRLEVKPLILFTRGSIFSDKLSSERDSFTGKYSPSFRALSDGLPSEILISLSPSKPLVSIFAKELTVICEEYFLSNASFIFTRF